MSNQPTAIYSESDTKARIFMVAAGLFGERGYNGVSMREISALSGVSKPTIYYYFGSKEGIFRQLVESGIAYGGSQFEQIRARPIPVKEKLVELVKSRFQVTLQQPVLSKFFLILFTSDENLPFLAGFKEEIETRKAALVDMLRDGIVSGEFGKSFDPQLVTEIINGIVLHFLRLQTQSPKTLLTDELAEKIVEILFKGLNE